MSTHIFEKLIYCYVDCFAFNIPSGHLKTISSWTSLEMAFTSKAICFMFQSISWVLDYGHILHASCSITCEFLLAKYDLLSDYFRHTEFLLSFVALSHPLSTMNALWIWLFRSPFQVTVSFFYGVSLSHVGAFSTLLSEYFQKINPMLETLVACLQPQNKIPVPEPCDKVLTWRDCDHLTRSVPTCHHTTAHAVSFAKNPIF